MIISHTEHYKRADGTVVGLGSTVTEINHLLDIFDSIIHVAMFHETVAPKNALPYRSKNIKFVALPALGGTKFSDKLTLLWKAPKVLRIVHDHIKQSDYFQFRAPTGIGVYVIPYLIWFNSKKGWFKYAGNWKQEHAPLSYRFQKWLLIHQSRIVTINGHWVHQPKHCLSFENPSLTQDEVLEGNLINKEKTFNLPINFCFVGRLEPAKGIDLLIDAIKELSLNSKKKIGVIHIVGSGDRLKFYKNRTKSLDVEFKFHGFLSRDKVREVYKKSNGIILPSFSEGFPKVISEAMNYGCIPIVSDVSSIGQYIIDGENGILIKNLDSNELKACIHRFLEFTAADYIRMVSNRDDFIHKCTFAYYNQHLKEVIF